MVFCRTKRSVLTNGGIFPETLKYWVGVQRGQSYLIGSASLALVVHHSIDGITIKIPYGVDVLLHPLASRPLFSY